MAILPLLIGCDQAPHSPMDQDGLHLTPDNQLTVSPTPLLLRDSYCPWRMNAHNQQHNQIGSIKKDKNKFQIILDVQHFAPEEISVKTSNGYIIIEAKHEEKKDDHGFISRQFSRRYLLPEGYNPELVESKLSSDGVLCIIVPKSDPEVKNERAVPIAQTGPVPKEIKDQASPSASANGPDN